VLCFARLDGLKASDAVFRANPAVDFEYRSNFQDFGWNRSKIVGLRSYFGQHLRSVSAK
jgi:hypothetical protein